MAIGRRSRSTGRSAAGWAVRRIGISRQLRPTLAQYLHLPGRRGYRFCVGGNFVGLTANGDLSFLHAPNGQLGVDAFAPERRQGLDGLARFLVSQTQLVELLEIEPKLRAGAKEMGQAQGGATPN